MKIQTGDKVRFLNEVGGGYVTRLEGNLVFVEDEDGFEIPVPVFEVVVVESASDSDKPVAGALKKPEKESKNLVVSEKETFGDELEEVGHDDFNPRFYLAFINMGKTLNEDGVLQAHLINDSNYYCTYLISELGVDGYMHALFQGNVEPNTKLQLKEIPVKEMDANWEVQLILYKKGKPFPAIKPVSTSLKHKAKRFFKENAFVGNDFFYQPAVLVSIIKNELEKKLDLLSEADTKAIIIEKEAKPLQKSSVKRQSTPELLEVDLHIHELLDKWDNLSNSEIIQIQMDKFQSVMEANFKNRGRRIVFIHGVGNGTLKTELRKQLDRKFKGLDYQDASFREYGYGATMVIIK